jgi:hypothetical protein
MSDTPDKEIHIDEDWKTQVEREKEAAKQAAAISDATAQVAPAEPSSAEQAARQRAAETTGQSQPYAEPAPEKPAPGRRVDQPHDYELPPASLAFLITTLGTQAMVALGDVPNPITGKIERQPKQAKHFIDTLSMLEEKTAGNRTPEESALLSSILHQLRMAYVSARETGAPS